MWRSFLKEWDTVATYEVEDKPEGLRIRCVAKRGCSELFWKVVLFVIVGALFLIGKWGWVGSLVMWGIAGWTWAKWDATVASEIEVNEHGFSVDGGDVEDYHPQRIVRWYVIWDLYYGEGQPGGEDSNFEPPGLWAKGSSTRTCLLPYVRRGQADALAQVIRDRFPNVRMQEGGEDGYKGLFREELVSLNLRGGG